MTKGNGEKKILFWAKYGSKTNNKTEGMENLLEIYTNNSMQRRNTVQWQMQHHATARGTDSKYVVIAATLNTVAKVTWKKNSTFIFHSQSHLT